ncbi:hypothetical protein NDU88_004766 [Pleurodeles waltl]|uniref:Uncharacterized protein n=1 Tax=Pleurodeles waltl TaxID=8319 RepID=A0AAV7T8R5_PLEWA|nr:hypothetical protein NDU88_004766 [Pleurodeles waltl]
MARHRRLLVELAQGPGSSCYGPRSAVLATDEMLALCAQAGSFSRVRVGTLLPIVPGVSEEAAGPGPRHLLHSSTGEGARREGPAPALFPPGVFP